MITTTPLAPAHHGGGRPAHRLVRFAVAGIALATTAACSPRAVDGGAAPTPTASHADATNPPTPTGPPTTTSGPARDPGPAATPITTTPPQPRPTGEVDRLVDVNGTRFYLHCEGVGAVTVVLIAGFESSSGTWSAVAPTLADHTRVCSYDRPGLGLSDPPTTTQSFSSQAADLKALLTAAGEVGSYVVVGHSFGGAQAIEFARELGDAALALVLVDASPVDWPATLCAISDDGTQAATFLRDMCDGWADPTNNAEHLDVLAAFDEIAAPPSLGSLPLTVLTAMVRELPPDISDSERHRLEEAWALGQRRWASLSSDAHISSVAETGHFIQLDRPDVVIDAVEALLP